MSMSCDESGKRLAAEAETLRTKGVYSEAIWRFNNVIDAYGEDDPNAAWAYAHRGAARAAIHDLGELDLGSKDLSGGAIADFEKARQLRRPNPYPWALAHEGEAYRLYAQYHIFKNGRGDEVYLDLLERSYKLFTEALDHQEEYPWALAHCGATRTYQHIICQLVNRHSKNERFAEDAEDLFNKAIESCPAYPWAYAFKAFLMAIRCKPNEARENMAYGLLIDVNQRLEVLEPSSALFNYKGDYERSTHTGWLRLQKDPFAIIASYFTAVGAKVLDNPMHQPIGCTARKAIFEKAQTILRHRMVLARTLDAALTYHKDPQCNEEAFVKALKELQEDPDLETYLILNLDSTLHDMRKKHPELFRPKDSDKLAEKLSNE